MNDDYIYQYIAVVIEDQGEIKNIIMSSRDETNEIRREKERLQSVFDQMTDEQRDNRFHRNQTEDDCIIISGSGLRLVRSSYDNANRPIRILKAWSITRYNVEDVLKENK